MKNFYSFPLVLLVCLLVANSIWSQAANLSTTKSETEKWRQDLRYTAAEMEARHKNLFHTISRDQFQRAISDLDSRLPELKRNQIIVEMMKIVAMVGDGHTNIYPTRDPKIAFTQLPVRLYLFSDGLLVRSAETSKAELVGSQVIKIGTVSAEEAVKRVAPLIGNDNPMGVKFFAPALLTMPEVLNAVGLSTSIDFADLTLEKGGRQHIVRLASAGPVEILPADTDTSWMPKDGWVDMRRKGDDPLWLRNAANIFWFEYLKETKTLYVQINQVGNTKDETLGDFAQRFLSSGEAKQAERLVLDFRLNRGGNGEMLKPMEIALIKSKFDQPGKLFVLMGRSTWSASQFFLDWMEKFTNTVFVGEPSGSRGNTYGDSRKITLPNSGVTVRVSIYYWQDWSPWDTRPWTSPAVTAEVSSSDYSANRDPALVSALKYSPSKSLLTLLTEALRDSGTAAALKTFREFKDKPENKFASTEEALLNSGQQLLNEKKPDQALKIFELDLAENPQSFRGYFAVGAAYAEMDKRAEAASYLEKALAMNPKDYEIAHLLKELRQ
jgi:hypothetical protein